MEAVSWLITWVSWGEIRWVSKSVPFWVVPSTKLGEGAHPPLTTQLTITASCTGVAVSAPWPKLKLDMAPEFSSSSGSGSAPEAVMRLSPNSALHPNPSPQAICQKRVGSSCWLRAIK